MLYKSRNIVGFVGQDDWQYSKRQSRPLHQTIVRALELKLNVSILIFHTLMGDGTSRRYNRTCSY